MQTVTYGPATDDQMSGWDLLADVPQTLTGVTCGRCSTNAREWFRLTGPAAVIRHHDVAAVRACFDKEAGRDAESRAERFAELANERYFEEGPNGGYYAGSEEEARDKFYDSLAGR